MAMLQKTIIKINSPVHMLLNVVSIGMSILHRCYYLSTKSNDNGDDFEFSLAKEGENEDLNGWNWLEYDLVWLKIAHILPNRSLAISHLAGSLILLASRFTSLPSRFASPNSFLIKMILLIAFIALLQLDLISHSTFITFAVILSLFNFSSSFFSLWRNRFDIKPNQDRSSKYGILLIHYSATIFFFPSRVLWKRDS